MTQLSQESLNGSNGRNTACFSGKGQKKKDKISVSMAYVARYFFFLKGNERTAKKHNKLI